MGRLRKRWIISLAFASLVLVLYAAHPLYLKALGGILVVSDPLFWSDSIIVLDGDYPLDERLLYAAELWRTGYAAKIVLSAKLAEWQTNEDFPTWRHAQKLENIPKNVFEVVSHRAMSSMRPPEICQTFSAPRNNHG